MNLQNAFQFNKQTVLQPFKRMQRKINTNKSLQMNKLETLSQTFLMDVL